MTLKGRLETTLNGALIATCVITCAALVNHMASSRSLERRQDDSLQAGDALPAIPGVNLANSDRTLIVVVRSSCKYCTESMPFYRTLVDRQRQARDARPQQVVFITPDDLGAASSYFATYEISPTNLLSGFRSLSSLRIKGTPTLVLTDRKGLVLNVWLGKLDEAHEREVFSRWSGGA